MRLAFELVNSVKQMPVSSVVIIIQSLEGLGRTKGGRREDLSLPLLPHWLSWDSSFYLLLSLDWYLYLLLPWFSGLQTQARTTLWLSWISSWQTADYGDLR